MADLSQTILGDLEGQNIDISHLGIEIRKMKGLFKKKKLLDVFGAVRSDKEKKTVLDTAARHAGELYNLEDNIKVRPH